jgi:hypothetical protein
MNRVTSGRPVRSILSTSAVTAMLLLGGWQAAWAGGNNTTTSAPTNVSTANAAAGTTDR